MSVSPAAENWLPVPNFDCYEVSDHGRMRSTDRTTVFCDGRRRTFPGQPLRGQTTMHGRRVIILARPGRSRKMVQVAHAVLAAFVGPQPDGMEACHNNGDKTDNHLSNLRWDTHSANMIDKVRHGNHFLANRSHCLRDHLLSGPNLTISRKGHRSCLACKRARQVNRRRPVDVQELADTHYGRIMEGSRDVQSLD